MIRLFLNLCGYITFLGSLTQNPNTGVIHLIGKILDRIIWSDRSIAILRLTRFGSNTKINNIQLLSRMTP